MENASEVLGIVGNLERIAGVVGGEKGNKDKRLAGPLLLIIYRDAIRFDLRQVNLPSVTCFAFFTAACRKAYSLRPNGVNAAEADALFADRDARSERLVRLHLNVAV